MYGRKMLRVAQMGRENEREREEKRTEGLKEMMPFIICCCCFCRFFPFCAIHFLFTSQ